MLNISCLVYKKYIYIYIYCKDSICTDPKMVLGLHVKGPNNKICRAWAERLGLGHRTMVRHGFYSNLHKGEPNVSNNTFF